MPDDVDSPGSSDVLLRLPESLRSALKEPMGDVYTDAEALLADVEGTLIAVGDVVTYHLETADRSPDVSVIDDKTEREPVDGEIAEALGRGGVTVENPAATLTEELLRTLREAIHSGEPTRVRVEGEEDLATLPAIVVAPDGASVVYGQPGEGMVHVVVTDDVRRRARDLLSRMDGDVDAALSILET